nr:flagellar biosynthetic protein FliR [Oleiagrimonas sp. C23AA]
MDISQLQQLIAAWLWPMARVTGLVLVAPVFGATAVPVRVRVGLVLVLTMVLAPLTRLPAHVDPLSLSSMLVVCQQVITGAAIGFVLRLAFEAVALGGTLIANTMGLSFAMVVDPQQGTQTSAMSQLYMVMATMLFLALNGHLALIQLLAQGMSGHNLAQLHIGQDDIWQLLTWALHLFNGAVRVALPALIALLIVNIGFGAISRAAPSMNLFAVGFPITLSLGLVVVWMSLRVLPGAFEALLDTASGLMRHLAGL